MRVEILRPYVLLLIPIFIGVLIWSGRYISHSKMKRRLILIFRNTMVILLILALAGISLKWDIRHTTNIFLVDLSSSAKDFKGEAEDFIREAIGNLPKDQDAGVLVFGQNVLVDRFINESKNYQHIASIPNENSTNIQNALTSALGLFPQDRAKRIVLFTDGEENEGEAERLISSMQEQNVDLKVLKWDREETEEVYVDYLSVPDVIRFGETFNVVVNIKSNVVTDVKLSLYSGRVKKGEILVDIQKGDNRFVFKDTGEDSGLKSYRVVIEPTVDTEIRNNEYTTFTSVESQPRVLLIEGQDGEGEELERILRASNLDYKKVNTAGVPRTLGELTEYKSILLANVHADDLNEPFMNNIKTYVNDYAGGLIATGGEDSFALGAYQDTPLEEVLPVSMDLQGENEIPEMSLVLVIDQSGSMSAGNGFINNLDLAKESAIKALDTLRNKDYIGVLAFDHTYEWIVEVQKADDKEAIEQRIQGIGIQGGTSIYPALEQAYLAQSENNAKIRHIILLTDGQDGYREYDELLENMNNEKITLSTVSVGDDVDGYLLETLAEIGQGRNYHTTINSDIPRIFAKEIFLSIREYVNNRTFYPVITSSHAILNGIGDGGIPALHGYIGASPKPTATVILKSDEEDPILTAWQYGLGKTVAWNSDMAGRWSSEYTNWSGNLVFWQNLLNWTVENYSDGEQSAKVTLEGNVGKIHYTTSNRNPNTQVIAIATDENGIQQRINLEPIKPGEFATTLPLDETGFYTINVREEVDGQIVGYDNTAVVKQYSSEYRFNQGSGVLEYLVEETGGRFIESPDEVFQGKMTAVKSMFDLTNLLLILALILLILDIAHRRLNFDYTKYFQSASSKIDAIKEQAQEKNMARQKRKMKEQGSKNQSATEASVKKEKKEKIKVKELKAKKKENVLNTTAALLEKKKDRY
jgi:uncharacterized membrane protein